ncbi:MAG: T9SS type A sorting domain-containing protein [Bacteroidota bacterium]
MKKILTFSAVLLALQLQAQINRFAIVDPTKTIKANQLADPLKQAGSGVSVVKNNNAHRIKPNVKPAVQFSDGKLVISKYAFATSGNIFGVTMSEVSCLSVNLALNTVLFVNRGGGSMGFTSNQAIGSWTPDRGVTYFNQGLPVLDDATHSNRYPSGGIYNPVGNTLLSNAFMSYSGSSHNNGTWNNDFFGSSRFDSTQLDVEYIPLATPETHEFARVGFSACNDGKVHVLADGGTYLASPALYPSIGVFTGAFNTTNNNFDWSLKTLPTGLKNSPDGDDYTNGKWLMAWSDDGSVGYALIFGIDSLNNFNDDLTPVTYKTTDHGANWNKLSPFDFYSIPVIQNKLDYWWQGVIGHTTDPRVYFNGSSGVDAIVDANNNLHILSLVQCGYSNHQDSLMYTYMYEPKAMFDVFTTAIGWDAMIIDTILTLPVDPDYGLSPGTANAQGWDHRMQLSKNQDGDKIMYIWTDSDTSFFSDNMAPDIFLKGYDLNAGQLGSRSSITRGTAYDGANYWMYAADHSFNSGTSNCYIIPITTTTHGAGSPDPCTHYYVKNVEYCFPQSAITTGTLTSTPLCAGSAINVPFTITQTFISGNVFTAQLSDVSGSFSSPVNIGTLTSTAAGTISATIPVSAASGSGYKIRVVSSNPYRVGSAGLSTITINALPVITANNPMVCSGITATLNASGASTYIWSDGLGTGSSVTATPAVTTTYTVTGTSSAGCVNTATAIVTIGTSLGVTVNSPTICSGESATLTAQGGVDYTWSGGLGTANPLVVTPVATTTYTVTGSVSSCTGSATAIVTVNPSPIVSLNSPTICAGQTATLTVASTPAANGWVWSGGLLGNPATCSPSVTTTYTVTATTAAGCSSTANGIVTVNPIPTVTVTGATICAGQTATLVASGAVTYYWNTGSTLNPLIVSPVNTTTYYVTGTSANGCQNTAWVSVNVYSVPSTPTITLAGNSLISSASSGNQWYLNGTLIPGATSQIYTPPVSGNYSIVVTISGCSSAMSTAFNFVIGISENQNEPFSIYPNPTSGTLNVDMGSMISDVEISILNLLGEEIKHFSGTNQNKYNLTMPDCAKGNYCIKVVIDGKAYIRLFQYR